MKWTTKQWKYGEFPDKLEPNVINWCHRENDETRGFLKYLCPVCEEHDVFLLFEHDRPKSKWWTPGENIWEFNVTDDGFVMNPSVQHHHSCHGHYWFKQSEPRIYSWGNNEVRS